MKTSIGDFLAILRKSKGLTQQKSPIISASPTRQFPVGRQAHLAPISPCCPQSPSFLKYHATNCCAENAFHPPNAWKRAKKSVKNPFSHILAAYRNNATIISWICIGLYIVAMIAALLIGCAAFESLIGFFVDCSLSSEACSYV